MTKVKKLSKADKAKAVEAAFQKFCDGYTQAIHAYKELSEDILQRNSAIIRWLVENLKFDNHNDVQRILEHTEIFGETIMNAIREKTLKDRDETLSKGSETANMNRANNASKNKFLIEKAVADYLNRAERDGLDKTNKAVIAFIQNTGLRTQLKKTKDKEYKNSTFVRDVALAAAKWRYKHKKKNAK